MPNKKTLIRELIVVQFDNGYFETYFSADEVSNDLGFSLKQVQVFKRQASRLPEGEGLFLKQFNLTVFVWKTDKARKVLNDYLNVGSTVTKPPY